MVRWREFWACLVVSALALALAGCSSGDDASFAPGSGQFGEPCKQSEDCASGLCVRKDASSGICTSACSSAAGCPKSPNWNCVQPDDFNLSVCACLPDTPQEICGDSRDNDCDGKVDDCRLCNGVSVPDNDPSHCGQCDNACRSDQSCSQGACRCPVDTPMECAGSCADLETDTAHCGACGNACKPGQICQSSACACPGANTGYCDGSGCVDLQSDVFNCGTCGTQCPSAQTCSGGSCICPSSGPPDYCAGVGCIDLDSDESNCGSCGNACGNGQSCVSGKCECPSTAPLFCNGSCVDPAFSIQNCGSCGNACVSTQNCVQGSCTCPGGGSLCNGSCISTSTDVNNCGSCGKQCVPGEYCSAGQCRCDTGMVCNGACVGFNDLYKNCGTCGNECPGGSICTGGQCNCFGSNNTLCPNGCANLQADKQNCGACGNACPANEICTNGSCVCPLGTSSCNGTCLNMSSDPLNCGSCGNSCRSGEICSAGQCTCALSSQQWCSTTNTCTDVMSNTQHCGQCDNTCRAGEICSSGFCRCPTSGQTWCNGTCINTTSDPVNCGGCGVACKPGETCSGGSCRCPFGQTFCVSANSCVNTYTDPNNCGSCGRVCPNGATCSSQVCVCGSGLALCGGNCVDVASDAQNCGGCGNTCLAGQTCTNSACECAAPTLGAQVRLTTTVIDSRSPELAYNGSQFGVVYVESQTSPQRGNLMFQLVNGDGTAAQLPVALTAFTDLANTGVFGPPDIIWNGSEFAVAWVDYTAPSTYEVGFMRLGPDGTPKSAPIYFPPAYTPRLVWSPTRNEYGLVTVVSQIRLRYIGADGLQPQQEALSELTSVASRPHVTITPTGQVGATVRASSKGYLVRFNSDGSRTDPAVLVASSAHQNVSNQYTGITWAYGWSFASTSIAVGEGLSGGKHDQFQSASHIYGDVLVGPSPAGSMDMIFTQALSNFSTSSFKLLYTRVKMPPAQFTLLDTPSEILSSANVASLGQTSFKRFGDKLMVVWSDNRWGLGEIYARSVDTNGCP